ncbi:Hsp70 family protein [Plantactinospora sp. KLBMP9567]|uniref:Hsp70 family protein n=1 Tax=Plantactinospora sp. KLBMP9567 TaxID=3085900 RepID=UPI0029810F9C|nr:transporter substrate-binding domain-containing protein [Plantactinospora sp. KLBMP9567]MDW5323685.1 transporter substrate-binding domain-containing protein [Plantactinospora sp. KLBMP9567]
MADGGFRLSVDYGTSHTVAVLRWPDGRTRPLLFDGSPLLSSATCVEDGGTVLSGQDATGAARRRPQGFEPHPKRRIGDGTLWLGDREVSATSLVAATLARVADEAARVAGPGELGSVLLTVPATWGPTRRSLLVAAAVEAGLPEPRLAAEPVAAASYLVGAGELAVPAGGQVAIYDLGAGTFDATVVRRTATNGFTVLATGGLPQTGGLDLDAALVGHVGRLLADRDPVRWRRLTAPDDDADRRAAQSLWDEARRAKESLSRTSVGYLHVPLFDESVPVGREEFEQLARVVLDQTVEVTVAAVRSAGPGAGPTTVVLVGGASRIPLAATLLHRALGVAPVVTEQPELVVAEGALAVPPDDMLPPGSAPAPPAAPAPPPGPAAPPPAPPAPPAGPATRPPAPPAPPAGPAAPVPGTPARASRSDPPAGVAGRPAPSRERGRVLLTGMLLLVILVGAVVLRPWNWPDDGAAGPTPGAQASPAFAEGTTMQRLQAAGQITIGSRFDLPGTGYREPDGTMTGFDVEIGRLIAGELGLDPADVQWTEAPSAAREQLVEQGRVDLVIATYTITETRAQRVAFAGPYHLPGQRLLVRADETAITGPESIPAGRQICTVTGTPHGSRLAEQLGRSLAMTSLGSYQECAEALLSGRVDAITGDGPALVGLVAGSDTGFRLAGRAFAPQPYGIGLRRDDEPFRAWLAETLRRIIADGRWQTAWQRTLGRYDAQEPTVPEVR